MPIVPRRAAAALLAVTIAAGPLLAPALAPAMADEVAPLHANDVSILLAAPRSADAPRVPADALLPAEVAEAAAAKIAEANGEGGGAVAVDPAVLTDRRAHWHVASLRIDPGAPGLSEGFDAFGRLPQIRLAVQPVSFEGEGRGVRDEALHLVYSFARPVADADQRRQCPLRFEPTEQDVAAFSAALKDLRAIRADLAARGIDTSGPLGVHPAFGDAEAAALLTARLSDFLAKHLPHQRLSALSVAGLPVPTEANPEPAEPWIFLALRRDPETGGFVKVSSPAIAQADPDAPIGRQMLSFLGGRRGEVVPAGLARNLLPVDCLFNEILPAFGLPQPDDSEGRTTSTLFGNDYDLEEARAVAAVVNDASRAHFFNTDCVSCHTETRREIDASPDADAAMAAMGDEWQIDPATLPASPDGADARFDHWNIRAFGWFPGFGRVPEGAHETVVRRTAAETAEVLACLNDGDWTDLSGPCIREDEAETVEQGWSAETREGYYHDSQGSAILPMAYFLALEAPGSRERFAAPANLARYGFLRSYEEAGRVGLARLPVGMTRTLLKGAEGPEEYVGLNCAACHTADVIAGGKRLRIDGAPAALDFDRFGIDLAEAVRTTAVFDGIDPETRKLIPSARLARFAARVGQIDPALVKDRREAFIGEFVAFAAQFTGRMALRRPAHPSGPGRVDALTQIVNALAVKDLGQPFNQVTPAVPTSYPPVWQAPSLEYVQYNLAVADPLTRNLGQALGVFGRTSYGPTEAEQLTSTANVATLELNESWMSMLQPPAWPEDLLGEIDTEKAETGRALFRDNCVTCHNAYPYTRTDAAQNANGDTFVRVAAIHYREAGTDPLYNELFTQRLVLTGALSPELRQKLRIDRAVIPGFQFLASVVSGVTQRARVEKAADLGLSTIPRERPAGHPDCKIQRTPEGDTCGYFPPGGGASLKAGPLTGVWATGPYLHNGSVRTVYEVISPPKERATRFRIGDRTLDAERLGFVDSDDPAHFEFDTTLPGNGNGGHVFWDEPFTHDERMAILEYLKADPEAFPIPHAERPDRE